MARFRFRAPWATAARLKTMMKRAGSGGRDEGILTDVFGEDSRFILEQGDLNIYRGFRHQEPNLVSIVDGKPEMVKNLEALVLRLEGNPVGAVSFLVQTNPRKSPPSDSYGRIDIVVVSAAARGMGLGRLLLLSANLVLLRNHGSSLYSISCLAAHPAVTIVLESVGFTPAAGKTPCSCMKNCALGTKTGAALSVTSAPTWASPTSRYATLRPAPKNRQWLIQSRGISGTQAWNAAAPA